MGNIKLFIYIWNESPIYLPHLRNWIMRGSRSNLKIQPNSCRIHDSQNIWFPWYMILIHQYIILLGGCNDANYESFKTEKFFVYFESKQCSIRDGSRICDKYPDISVFLSYMTLYRNSLSYSRKGHWFMNGKILKLGIVSEV